MQEVRAPFWRDCRFLVLVTGCLVLAGQFGRDVWTPDEPRVAAIGAEMGQTGNWVVPKLAGLPFMEKPPLGYALYAVADRALGSVIGDVNAMRATNVLLAFGMLWLTFLLGRRLSDRETGLLAAIVLGSSLGFIENVHWLRVDLALGFFVLLSVLLLLKATLEDRIGAGLAAGLSIAAAFLTKGIIGPAFIFLAWMPMAFARWQRFQRERHATPLFLVHGVILVSMLLPIIGWALALQSQPDGAHLWREWFWENQVGRATGNAATLGHMHPGDPVYYLLQLLQYSFPWLPFPFIAAWAWLRRREPGVEPAVVASWFLGSMLLLSIAVEKRPIYLFPVMPAIAIMTALHVKQSNRVIKAWPDLVLMVTASMALLFAAMPILVKHYASRVPLTVLNDVQHVGIGNVVGIGLLILTLWFMRRARTLDAFHHYAGAAILFFAVLFVQVMPVASSVKGMRSQWAEFSARIPLADRSHIAGVNLPETERGLLWLYDHWAVASLESPASIIKVLDGQDTRFDSLLVGESEHGQPLAVTLGAAPETYCVLAQARTRSGNAGGSLFWIAGRNGKLCKTVVSSRPIGAAAP